MARGVIENAAARLERVLTTDPGTGVMRHADAGYEEALAVAADLSFLTSRAPA